MNDCQHPKDRRIGKGWVNGKQRQFCKDCGKSSLNDFRVRIRRHGKLGEYTNHGCRCELCRKANTDWQKSYWAGKKKNDPECRHLLSIKIQKKRKGANARRRCTDCARTFTVLEP